MVWPLLKKSNDGISQHCRTFSDFLAIGESNYHLTSHLIFIHADHSSVPSQNPAGQTKIAIS